jgi:hypothetical protein
LIDDWTLDGAGAVARDAHHACRRFFFQPHFLASETALIPDFFPTLGRPIPRNFPNFA